MAAFAQPKSNSTTNERPTTPHDSSLQSKRIRSETIFRESDDSEPRKRRTRQLPQGSCNYRDIDGHSHVAVCGCVRFWQLDGAEWHCVCGHHACYHQQTEGSSLIRPRSSMGPPLLTAQHGVQSHQTSASFNVQQHGHTNALASFGDMLYPDTVAQDNHQLDMVPAEIGPNKNVDVDSSGMPPYPSMILLDKDKFNRNIQAKPSRAHVTPEALPRQPTFNPGLGLYLRNVPGMRVPSPSPTIADADQITAISLPTTDSQIPSTRQPSNLGSLQNISPDSGFKRRLLEARMAAQRPLNTTVPTSARGIFLRSATEPSTPSLHGTPDLQQIESSVSEMRRLVEDIINQNSPTPQVFEEANIAESNLSGKDDSTPANLAVASIASQVPHDGASNASLISLQRLLPHLNSLQSVLAAYPQLSGSLRAIAERLDMLETASFTHVPPEVFQERYEMVDTRLVEVESRLSEQSRRLGSVENVQTTLGFVPTESIEIARSFASNQSDGSTTSSAMILAAIDKVDVEARLKDVEDRLENLETNALPSASDPWEIEVILLPWGRQLQGIWLATVDFDTNTQLMATQDDEDDWQQSRNTRSSSKAGSSFHSTSSGWSSQAIHAWARDTDEWLSPKACGTQGVVYHRLKSRGLVRTVSIKSSDAKSIQTAICTAFGSTLGTINGFYSASKRNSNNEDGQDADVLGLQARFVPLRKERKSSRLRYLTRAEMATPVLWNSEFLASGIMMRAAGGQKRLFITTREAYLQGDTTDDGWTWPKLRDLPRVKSISLPLVTPDDVGTGGQDEPAEADAREACWAHHPALDDVRVDSSESFASFKSQTPRPVRVRRQDRQHSFNPQKESRRIQDDQRTIEYNMDDKNQQPIYHPITPISEFPTQRSDSRVRRVRQRTVSMPATDMSSVYDTSAPRLNGEVGSRVGLALKRQVHSFEATTNPLIGTLPSFVPNPDAIAPRSSSKRRKRRKLDGTSDQPRERSVSWDLPGQDEKYQVDTEELDLYRRHLAAPEPSWAVPAPRADQQVYTTSTAGLGSAPERRVSGGSRDAARRRTPSFFPTPVSRGSEAQTSSSQQRRSDRRTTEDFLADLQDMDARGAGRAICREVGCDHAHHTTDSSHDERLMSAALTTGAKGERGTTPFAYATPYSGPVTRSIAGSEVNTVPQILPESEDVLMDSEYDDDDFDDDSDGLEEDGDDEDDEDEEDVQHDHDGRGAISMWNEVSSIVQPQHHSFNQGSSRERSSGQAASHSNAVVPDRQPSQLHGFTSSSAGSRPTTQDLIRHRTLHRTHSDKTSPHVSSVSTELLQRSVSTSRSKQRRPSPPIKVESASSESGSDEDEDEEDEADHRVSLATGGFDDRSVEEEDY